MPMLEISRRKYTFTVDQTLYRPELEGVTFTPRKVKVDRRLYSEYQARIIGLASGGLPIAAPPVATLTRTLEPTEADLAAINREALTPLQAADVVVFDRYVVNDQRSRTGLRLTTDALTRLTEDYREGRSRALLGNLPEEGHGGATVVGATFSAELVEATVRGIEGYWIKTREYIPRAGIDPRQLALITSGVLRFDSAGFMGGGVRMADLDAGETLEIFDDETAPVRLQAREVTFVYLGEILGAGSDRGRQFTPDAEGNANGNGLTKQDQWVISI